MKAIPLAAVLILGFGVAPAATAGDRPPQDAKPLSQVIAGLEKQGYGPFSEVEFDDGRWEIEVYREGKKRKLEVDPSGRITSDRDDD